MGIALGVGAALGMILGVVPLSGCASEATTEQPLPDVAASASQAEGGPQYRHAAILDIESDDGKPVGVIVNLGSDTVPLRPGSWGLIQNGEHPIGWVKVAEVSPTRSRADIQGTLSEPIAKDAKVILRIREGSSSEPGSGS